jgi:hypothetical protein
VNDTQGYLFTPFTAPGSQAVNVPDDNLEGASLDVVNNGTGATVTIDASPDDGTTWFPVGSRRTAGPLSIVSGFKQRWVLSGLATQVRVNVAGITAGTTTIAIVFPKKGDR